MQMGCHHRADDAMAILFAFQSPELDVIGLTTTYGNVKTTMATNNALHLVWRSSSLCLSLCVPICPVFAIPVTGLHLGFGFEVMLCFSVWSLLSNLSCFCNSSYVFALRV